MMKSVRVIEKETPAPAALANPESMTGRGVGEGDGVVDDGAGADGSSDGASETLCREVDEGNAAALGVIVGAGVTLGDAPSEMEDVGDPVPLCVGVAVDDPVPVGVDVRVFVLLTETGDVEIDAELLPDAPGERGGVGVTLTVDDALIVDEPVSDPVGVPERVDVAVPVALVVCDAVGVREDDCVVVALADPLSLPVLLGLAPLETLAVGVHDTEREGDCVVLGVSLEVAVGVAVGETVGVPLAERVDVVEGLPLLLGVSDALAPIVTDGVSVLETEDDREAVVLGVGDGVPVVDTVGVPVDVLVGVGSAVAVEEVVPDGETVAERETDGVPLAVPPTEIVAEGVALTVFERLRVVDPLSDPVGVCDGVIDDVPVPLPVRVAVGVTDRLVVDVALSVPLSLPVLLGLAPRVTLAVGVREIERERLAVELGVSDEVGVGDDVVDAVGVPLSETVGDADALAPMDVEDVPVLECDDDGVPVADGVCELVPEGVPVKLDVTLLLTLDVTV